MKKIVIISLLLILASCASNDIDTIDNNIVEEDINVEEVIDTEDNVEETVDEVLEENVEVNEMGKKVVMIVAPDQFRDEELLEPMDVLENNGIEVVVASKDTDMATGMLGAAVSVNLDYSEINVDDYEGLIFVGGTGATMFFNDEKAWSLANEAHSKNKLVGAICIAPSILANAGLLDGKQATAYPSEESNLVSNGAQFTGERVTVDDNIITGSGPEAATEFGEGILRLI